MIEPSQHADRPKHRKRDEILAFLILAVVIWPVLSVGMVGGYGFLVWVWQMIFGPPGPMH